MNILIRLFVNAAAVVITAYILPGVHVDSFVTALLVALVLGIINAVVKPVLIVLTFPITLLTVGLFIFVINAALILLTSKLVPGFSVASFWWALGFSIVLSLISSILHQLTD